MELSLHPGLRNQSMFQDFRRMRRVFQSGVNECMDKLKIPCVTSQLLVLKTLRLTMEMAQKLLVDDQNLKLIFLVRDPRGILVSREKVQYLSEVLRPDMEVEASLLCPKMARDLSRFEELRSKHPKRALLLRYEDAADNPRDVVHEIYNFVGACEKPLQWVTTACLALILFKLT